MRKREKSKRAVKDKKAAQATPTPETEFERMVQFACSRPGMYIPQATFLGMCCFLDGFDYARDGGTLCGFREWMIVRLNGGNNLAWFGLASHLIPDQGDEKQRIAALGDLICEFLRHVRAVGLAQVFWDYQTWLKRQSWYTPAARQKSKAKPAKKRA